MNIWCWSRAVPHRSLAHAFRCLTLFVFATSAIAGCKQSVDLAAVRDLAQTASSAQGAMDALAADYYDSCVRRTVYQQIGADMQVYFSHPIARQATVVLEGRGAGISLTDFASAAPAALAARLTPDRAARISPEEFAVLSARADSSAVFTSLSVASLTAMSASPALRSSSKDSVPCQDESSASKSWESANGVLVAYFVALGKLAGGVSSDADVYGTKAFSESLVPGGVLSKAQADAVGSFADNAIAAVFDAKRRNALAEYIPQASSAVCGVTKMLQSVANDHYSFALSQEHAAADRFFKRNIRLSRPGADAFQTLSFADAWGVREKAFTDRASAISAYNSTLEKLCREHTALLSAIDKNDTSAALAIAQAYYASMKPDVDAIRKAFSEEPK